MFHTFCDQNHFFLPLVAICPWTVVTVVTVPTLLSEGQGVTSPCVPKSPRGCPSTFINEQLKVKHQQRNNNNNKGLYFNGLKENVIPRAKRVIKTTKVLQANWSNLHRSLPKAARDSGSGPWLLPSVTWCRATLLPESPPCQTLAGGTQGTSQPWGNGNLGAG